MSEPPSHQPPSSQAIWIASISAIGAIVVAMIANWKSLFPDRQAEQPPKPGHSEIAPADRKSGATAAAGQKGAPVTEVLTPHRIRVHFAYSVPCNEWIGYKHYRTGNWVHYYFQREAITSSEILKDSAGSLFVTGYGALIRVAVPSDMRSTLSTKREKLRENNLLEKQAIRMKLVDGVFHTPVLKCE